MKNDQMTIFDQEPDDYLLNINVNYQTVCMN